MERLGQTVTQNDKEQVIKMSLRLGCSNPDVRRQGGRVKSAFNKSDRPNQEGEFQIKIECTGDDLFLQVAN